MGARLSLLLTSRCRAQARPEEVTRLIVRVAVHPARRLDWWFNMSDNDIDIVCSLFLFEPKVFCLSGLTRAGS